MNKTIEQLRKIVADQNRSEEERKAAAEHIIKLQQSSAAAQAGDDPRLAPYMIERDDPSWKEIPDDDPEVLRQRFPKSSPEAASLWPHLCRERTFEEAKRIVAKERKQRAVYAVIVDDEKPRAERVTAIQHLLDNITGWHSLKQSPAEALLDRIRPSGSFRPTLDGNVQVRRPPESLMDIWVL